MTDAGFFEALVEHCPSWGYLFLLAFALITSIAVAGMGMRVCAAVLGRVFR
jgi:hypothetical protein